MRYDDSRTRRRLYGMAVTMLLVGGLLVFWTIDDAHADPATCTRHADEDVINDTDVVEDLLPPNIMRQVSSRLKVNYIYCWDRIDVGGIPRIVDWVKVTRVTGEWWTSDGKGAIKCNRFGGFSGMEFNAEIWVSGGKEIRTPRLLAACDEDRVPRGSIVFAYLDPPLFDKRWPHVYSPCKIVVKNDVDDERDDDHGNGEVAYNFDLKPPASVIP